MSSCIDYFVDERGMTEDQAGGLCQSLKEEEKSDLGNVAELREAIENGAGLIADVGVDLVSGVDVPAVDSKWVMTKSADAADGHDYRAQSPILLAKADDGDKRLSYAAAMIPREPDKEGDVVATPTVEKAAHGFLKGDGGVDTDHSLIDGEGEVVESWVLKQDRAFDLPGGESETYAAGTWMVGIEWGKDAWERIKDGELTGLSIYGKAEHVPIERSALPAAEGVTHKDGLVAVEWAAEDWDLVERRLGVSKSDPTGDSDKGEVQEADDMGQDTDDSTEADDGPTLAEVAASVDDLAETVNTVKETVETEKQDREEAAADLADAYGMDTGDVMDILTLAEGKDIGAVIDALDNLEAEQMEESADEADKADEDAGEAAETETTEKRADEANLAKGGDGTATAQKGVTDDGSAEAPSYADLADGYGGSQE